MIDRLRRHPIATTLAGAVLAGMVAVVGAAFGLPDPYPLIVGLAVAIPPLNIVSGGERFDADAYWTGRGPAGVAVDVLFSVAGAGLIGGLIATIALRAGLSGILLGIVAAIATVIGGVSVFGYRNSDYYGPE